jgi:hypothetical protein
MGLVVTKNKGKIYGMSKGKHKRDFIGEVLSGTIGGIAGSFAKGFKSKPTRSTRPSASIPKSSYRPPRYRSDDHDYNPSFRSYVASTPSPPQPPKSSASTPSAAIVLVLVAIVVGGIVLFSVNSRWQPWSRNIEPVISDANRGAEVYIKPLPSPVVPPGSTTVLNTPSGPVTVNNFFRGAKMIEASVYIAETDQYTIIYFNPSGELGITLGALDPSEAQRRRGPAESALLSALGVSRADACRLNVRVSPSGSFKVWDAPDEKLSFCP